MGIIKRMHWIFGKIRRYPLRIFAAETWRWSRYRWQARRDRMQGDFGRAVREGQDAQAIGLGMELLQRFPADGEIRQRFCELLKRQGDRDEASQQLRVYLEGLYGPGLEQMTSRILEKAGMTAGQAQVSYSLKTGHMNLGFVEYRKHPEDPEPCCITKLCPLSGTGRAHWDKETFFYGMLREAYSRLQDITPELVDVFADEENKIGWLTLGFVSGKKPGMQVVPGLLQAAGVIGSIPGREVLRLMEADPGMRRHTPYLRWMTKTSHLQWTTDLITDLANRPNCPPDGPALARRVDRVVRLTGMVGQMHRKNRWVLSHGDFGIHNLLGRHESHQPVIIDWTSFGLGYRGEGLPAVFLHLGMDYHDMLRLYLDMEAYDPRTAPDPAEHMFFQLDVVLSALKSLARKQAGKEDCEELFTGVIRPAVGDLERESRDMGGAGT